MSLLCGEHKDHHEISVGTKIYGALLPGSNKSLAFCERALAVIPTDTRHAEAIPNGVDIHIATSKADLGGISTAYSMSDLQFGRRLFSISRGSATCREWRRCCSASCRLLSTRSAHPFGG